MASTSSSGALGACILVVALTVTACSGGSSPGQSQGGTPSGDVSSGDVPATPAPASPQVPGAPAPAEAPPSGGPAAPAIGADLGLGPPDWVQAGTLLTHYGATASVAASHYTYVEDPEGTWEDPVSGKRYRRTDEGGGGGDMPTAASQAFTQTEVLAVEGTDVVISTTLYSIDLLANQYTLTPMGGARQGGTLVDGAWANPDALQQALVAGYGDYLVLHGPYVLGDATYDALSFVAQGGGAYLSTTYDLASGALLAMNSSTQGADAPVHGPLDNPQGNTQLALTKIAGLRQRSLPGMGTPPPSWVVPGQQLAYSGTYTQVNPVDPGSGPWVYPMQSTITFGEVGSTWAAFTNHDVIVLNGYEQPTDGAGVTGSTGLYWYAPAALAGMSPGDLVDEDPITGARITVESVESVDLAGSGVLVALTMAMDGVTVRTGYDRDSGVLVTLEINQAVTGSTVQLHLVD